MDERHLHPEQARPRFRVDQLGARGGHGRERRPDVVDAEGDVVHPRPALGQEPADRRVLVQWPEELDPVGPDPQGHRLDALIGHGLAVLHIRAEQALVCVHRGRKIRHGMPDMMNRSGVHWTASYENTDEGDRMGFLDKLKQQATDVASTVAEKTQETAKVGQLQVQLRNLRGEERDALTEFGREAYGLYQQHALSERSGELAGAAAKITDIQAQVAAKEQEIADVRGASGDGAGSETVESSAEEVAEPPSAATDTPADESGPGPGPGPV